MISFVRAGLAAAFIALALVPASAADKAFKRSDLGDAAIKLEAQIKQDAGTVTKSLAHAAQGSRRRLQEARFPHRHAGAEPHGHGRAAGRGSWLRLARTVRADRSARRPREGAAARPRLDRRLHRLSARHGPQRGSRQPGAARPDAGRPPALAAGARRHAAVAAICARPPSCAANTSACASSTASGCSTTRSIPMRSRRAPASSSRKRCPAGAPISRPSWRSTGIDKPAVSVNDKQLCVEGLKHGQRYQITLRAGCPRPCMRRWRNRREFTVFVRDRKPFVRFSGKAYVLPRSGQQRHSGAQRQHQRGQAQRLPHRRPQSGRHLLGYDFQRNISGYQAENIARERGTKVWSGELAVEQKLNTEVTTAFPVDKALGKLEPGVYVMTATPKDLVRDDYGALATQWFIVSDLGLTAYSGHDGIDVFIHSLASAEPSGGGRGAADRARQRGARRRHRPTPTAFCISPPGWRAGRAANRRPPSSPAPRRRRRQSKTGDYAFLSLKSPAFDLTDRGVGGRQVPAGLDAFVYTERGVYRRGETVHVTTLLRDARGVAVDGGAADAGDGAAGRRRIPPLAGGRCGASAAAAGTCRSSPPPCRAPGGSSPIPIPSARRSARRPSWSRTTCPTASSSI